MAKPKGTCKYYFEVGNKIVYGGITNDLERKNINRNGLKVIFAK